jgi:hypothetical protein
MFNLLLLLLVIWRAGIHLFRLSALFLGKLSLLRKRRYLRANSSRWLVPASKGRSSSCVVV